MDDEAALSEISRDILAYLLENPDARDTLTGVAEWWLLQQQVERCLREVEASLGELVEAGYVEMERTGDGVHHYVLGKRRTEEIRRLLAARRRDG